MGTRYAATGPPGRLAQVNVYGLIPETSGGLQSPASMLKSARRERAGSPRQVSAPRWAHAGASQIRRQSGAGPLLWFGRPGLSWTRPRVAASLQLATHVTTVAIPHETEQGRMLRVVLDSTVVCGLRK